MKKTLIKLFAIVSLFSLSVLSLAPLSTYAANETTSADVCNSSVPDSVKQAAGCNNSDPELGLVVVGIINATIGVAAVISVIYVIVGGYSYMTSSGDSQKLEKAKKTILYAVIGLAICVLAFAIVNFAINNIINVGKQA